MGFAKFVLVAVILCTATLALYLRFRAWRARRTQEQQRRAAEIERDLGS